MDAGYGYGFYFCLRFTAVGIFSLLLFSDLETLDPWDFNGVKPSKGQDCGRSSFSYLYDRDRGVMKKKCTVTL
jgi:hypothetical protein